MSKFLLTPCLDVRSSAWLHVDIRDRPEVFCRPLQERGIPILVEAERLRDSLPDLLQYATYVTSSAHYPRVISGAPCDKGRLGCCLALHVAHVTKCWPGKSPQRISGVLQHATGHEQQGDAMVAMLASLPDARWLVSTQGGLHPHSTGCNHAGNNLCLLQFSCIFSIFASSTAGARGSILLERSADSHAVTSESPAPLNDVLEQLWLEVEQWSGAEPGCSTADGAQIG